MTEEIAATPGWVDSRLDELFAQLPTSLDVIAARNAYSSCLGARKAPAAPSDILGAEFASCRPALHRALTAARIEDVKLGLLDTALEALEAEIATDS